MKELDARRLHAEALVVDTLFSIHLRAISFTPRMTTELSNMVTRKVDVTSIMARMTELFNEQLYAGEVDQEFWGWWDRSGVDVILTTVGTEEAANPQEAFDSALRETAGWIRRFDTFSQLKKVVTSEDIDYAWRNNKRGVILGFQNSNHVGDDLRKLEVFHDLGIRVIQPTYNLHNSVGDGCTVTPDRGLTKFGKEFIGWLNSLKILIDLSHCGPRTTLDAISQSDVPVAITHSFCQALNNHVRGKSDEVLRALAQNDGYLGILTLSSFLAQKEASLETLVNHLEHAASIVGVDRIGIGSDSVMGAYPAPLPQLLRARMYEEIDRDGVSHEGWREGHFNRIVEKLIGYDDWRSFPDLTVALLRRGFSEEEVRGILGKNFRRVFQAAVL